MQKIKLTERQIQMLQKLEENSIPKRKVLKINESQYKRLFSEDSKGMKKLHKNDIEINDNETKDIDLVEFAEEVIVFIKDILSSPKKMNFSSYWDNIGISKSELFDLAKKKGLIKSKDDEFGLKEYVSEKHGFRKKVKELYNEVCEKYGMLDEAGGNAPLGMDYDARNPDNYERYSDEEGEENRDVIKADREIMQFLYFSECSEITIFKYKDNYFALHGEAIDGELLEPYQDIEGISDGIAYYNFVNDNLINKRIKAYKGTEKFKNGQLALLTPEVKSIIAKWCGEDRGLMDTINQIPETTTAGSSGAYTGKFLGDSMSSGEPVKRGYSPEKAIGDTLTEEDENNPWAICTASVGREDKEKYESCVKQVKKDQGMDENLEETTDTVSVGGDSGTFAYDAPAGDNSDFWTAGNKQSKKNDNPKGLPIVKAGYVSENSINKSSVKAGQIYKNGLFRRKVKSDVMSDTILGKPYVKATEWGPKPDGTIAKDLDKKVYLDDWGAYELMVEHKVLKITESQLAKILESENLKKTAYPHGKMISFDDCTKLNNNKVAQKGGCSQGAVDNVVKTRKTKGSVVAENFNPQIGAGSVYAIEVKPVNGKVALIQDNGQTVVIDYNDIPDVIRALNKHYKSIG